MEALHCDVVAGTGAVPRKRLFLVHGIYGSARTWRSVATRLVRERSDWDVALADLRGHGRSPAWRAKPSVEACARDLLRLEEQWGGPADAVLGHSFGGKVALLRVKLRRRTSPKQVWAIDSGLGAGRPSGGAWEMLGTLRRCPGPFASRAEAEDAVARQGYCASVAKWMATNARETASGWAWRLRADDMEALLRSAFRVSAWDVVESPPSETSIHVVKARDSGALGPSAVARLRQAAQRRGKVHFHEAPGGHWLNVDNPDALVRLLAAGLPE